MLWQENCTMPLLNSMHIEIYTGVARFSRLSCTFYVPSYKGAYHLYESVCAVEAIISKQKVILSNGYYDYKLGNLIKY